MKNLLLITAAAVGMVASSSAAVTYVSDPTVYKYSAADAFKVGAFVKNNFTAVDSESEGAVVVGGAFNVSGNGYQVKIKQGAVIPNNLALAVTGNVAITGNNPQDKVKILEFYDFSSTEKRDHNEPKGSSNASNAVVDQRQGVFGTINGSTSTADNRSLVNQGYPTNISSSPAQGGLASGIVSVTQAFNDLQSLSDKILTRPSNSFSISGTSVVGFTKSNATLISDTSIIGKQFYLLSISAASLAGGQALNGIDMTSWGSGDLIVVNVIGAGDINFRLSFPDGEEWANNLLWNVNGGNKVTAANSQFTGSLLAPKSTFTQDGVNVAGTLIVDTFVQTRGAELHPILFGDGGLIVTTTSVVPEPTTAVVGALLALGLCRRQRR